VEALGKGKKFQPPRSNESQKWEKKIFLKTKKKKKKKK